MTQITQFTDEQSLKLANKCVGLRFSFVTGHVLPEFANHLAGIGNIRLDFDGLELSVKLEPCELDFRGYPDDYGQISIDIETPKTADSGLLLHKNYRFKNQDTEQVFVIRESTRFIHFGEPKWEFNSDIGFVFELSEGCVGVYKAGYQGSQLEVALASTLAMLDIPDRHANWTFSDELGDHYEFTREFIPIDELLKGAKD